MYISGTSNTRFIERIHSPYKSVVNNIIIRIPTAICTCSVESVDLWVNALVETRDGYQVRHWIVFTFGYPVTLSRFFDYYRKIITLRLYWFWILFVKFDINDTNSQEHRRWFSHFKSQICIHNKVCTLV